MSPQVAHHANIIEQSDQSIQMGTHPALLLGDHGIFRQKHTIEGCLPDPSASAIPSNRASSADLGQLAQNQLHDRIDLAAVGDRIVVEQEQAVLSEKLGNSTRAVQQLGRAVSLANPGGFIRLFVDIGPDLVPLLNRLDVKGQELQYIGRILAAFHSTGSQKKFEQGDAHIGVTIRDVKGMPEPLSPREKEVLALLAQRFSNKEIGEKLFIATTTVKRHAQTIYQKLNVQGRREAVTKATGLGLIHDE